MCFLFSLALFPSYLRTSFHPLVWGESACKTSPEFQPLILIAGSDPCTDRHSSPSIHFFLLLLSSPPGQPASSARVGELHKITTTCSHIAHVGKVVSYSSGPSTSLSLLVHNIVNTETRTGVGGESSSSSIIILLLTATHPVQVFISENPSQF